MRSKGNLSRRASRPAAKPRGQRETAYLSRAALCSLGGITEDQLALWEFEEFIGHAAVMDVDGLSERVYEPAALHRVRVIRSLGEDLGVNLPGIGVILHLLDQLAVR